MSSLYAQTHRLSCLPISTMAISCSDTVSWRAAYFSWSSACSCLDHTSHMTIYLNSMHRTKHSKFEPHLFEWPVLFVIIGQLHDSVFLSLYLHLQQQDKGTWVRQKTATIVTSSSLYALPVVRPSTVSRWPDHLQLCCEQPAPLPACYRAPLPHAPSRSVSTGNRCTCMLRWSRRNEIF